MKSNSFKEFSEIFPLIENLSVSEKKSLLYMYYFDALKSLAQNKNKSLLTENTLADVQVNNTKLVESSKIDADAPKTYFQHLKTDSDIAESNPKIKENAQIDNLNPTSFKYDKDSKAPVYFQ